MRTTVTLDPDVEALVKRTMRERGSSFKEAVNDAIRAALAHPGSRAHYCTPTADLGRATVNLDRALVLASELEDEELLRKQRSGK